MSSKYGGRRFLLGEEKEEINTKKIIMIEWGHSVFDKSENVIFYHIIHQKSKTNEISTKKNISIKSLCTQIVQAQKKSY